MPSKTFKAILIKDDKTSGCWFELPFNPKEEYGKVRMPVKVTINKFTFRTTVFSMRGCYLIGINKQYREGAGIMAGDTITVKLEPDSEPRVITPPDDLLKALQRNKKIYEKWQKLSYTHQKEHVNSVLEAKKPETRVRRIDKTIEMLKG